MEVLVLDGLRLLVGKSSRNNVPSSTLDKAEYLGRFAFLPRLSFLGRFASFVLFSTASWFFWHDLFPCHYNFFSCCMSKCRYFCIVRVELQKGVTRSLESWDITYFDPCLPIFKNICKWQPSESSDEFNLSTHEMRCFAISHWILRFGHNLQGSSRQKSRFALFCGVLRRVCGVLRLVCVHVSVLNVSVCY